MLHSRLTARRPAVVERRYQSKSEECQVDCGWTTCEPRREDTMNVDWRDTKNSTKCEMHQRGQAHLPDLEYANGHASPQCEGSGGKPTDLEHAKVQASPQCEGSGESPPDLEYANGHASPM